ncbi:VWA domain-containing protein, partial [Alcanivorax sp. HI0044]
MMSVNRLATMLCLALCLPMANVYADDTEIFFADADADNNQNAPAANVMVMLDSSGSMAWCETSNCQPGEVQRIDMTKEAFSDMVDALPDRVNMGLGRFHNGNDGKVIFPVSEMTDGGRAAIKYAVNEIFPTGGTPT